jgi:hypothetical protein
MRIPQIKGRKVNRLWYNLRILGILIKFLKKNPDIRFIQALYALQIIQWIYIKEGQVTAVDKFNEEPDITLKNLKECLNSMKLEEQSGTAS